MPKLCKCGCGRPAPIAMQTKRSKGWVKGRPKRFVNGHNSHICNLHHGQTRERRMTPEYRAYAAARQRCTNPNSSSWKNYGGRGIRFLFISFDQFFACLGPRPSPGHSIDRINNDDHYRPENVRWATWFEQALTRRKGRK